MVTRSSQARHLSTPHLLSTLEALAVAIDAKDNSSVGHIPRVRLYATALARALGVSENDVHGIDVAAILHDIGKLAVPEYILLKAGPLTPDEFQKIRAHPRSAPTSSARCRFRTTWRRSS